MVLEVGVTIKVLLAPRDPLRSTLTATPTSKERLQGFVPIKCSTR
jgi:hypothetical protein